MMNKYGQAHDKKALSEYITQPSNERKAMKEAKAMWVDDLTQVNTTILRRTQTGL